MNCLSIRPAWAHCIAHGWKDVENRSWRTDYRGPLAIHASKTQIPAEHGAAQALLDKVHPGKRLPGPAFLTRGAVIAVVDLVGIADEYPESPWWIPGEFAWVLENPRLIYPLLPLKGQLGLFNVELKP